MDTPAGTSDDRGRLHAHVFEIVRDIQAGQHELVGRLSEIEATARSRGWAEVVRAALFGRAVAGWIEDAPGYRRIVEELLEESSADHDEVMIATSLAMRSVFDDSDDEHLAAERDADLARAAVILEEADGGLAERISAHTACGIGFGMRSLFELGDEQYSTALELGSADRAELGAVLEAIVFNLAETQVSWASMLRQLGDDDGVAHRLEAFRRAAQASHTVELPERWRHELEALGILLTAMSGEDRSADAAAALQAIEPSEDEGWRHRSEGLLVLAIALSDARAGREVAGESARRAVAVVDASVHPQLYDLALHIAAELEAASGHEAGLAYARRLLQENWTNRLSRLGAMRSRIEAERLSRQHEVLSRYAHLDDLTGVGNRRALDLYLAELRGSSAMRAALIMVDVDGFKHVNDSHGHLAGDAVLRQVAGILAHAVRSADLAVRLGGDEFAVILADTGLEVASERARHLLAAIDAHPWHEIDAGLVVKVSMGVAAGSPFEMSDIRARADRALYEAKAAGGHGVVLSEAPDDPALS